MRKLAALAVCTALATVVSLTGAAPSALAGAALPTGNNRGDEGLLPVDWSAARWISDPVVDPVFDEASWIGHSGDSSSPGAVQRYYRRTVTAADSPIVAAKFLLTADDSFQLTVNGTTVHDSAALAKRNAYAWQVGQLVDLTGMIEPGENTLVVRVDNRGGSTGLLGSLEVTHADGEKQVVNTDGGWESSTNGIDGWATATTQAAWNGAPWTTAARAPRTPVLLRGDFMVAKQVKRATVHASALGTYELKLNGRVVSDDRFAPGWTDYNLKVPYQSYDVTRLVQDGGNALAATVAEGWYAGALMAGQHRYGESMGFRAQLVIQYADDTEERIGTDGSWRAGYGGLSRATVYDGETYDARREPRGWDKPGFDAGAWRPVVERADLDPELISPQIPPQRIVRTIKAQSVTKLAEGVHRFDFGENFSGHVRLKVRGAAGDTVELRYVEWLNEDGSSYRANLRGADATDFYTLAGTGSEAYEPRFTSHGFRYVEVRGFPGEPPLEAVEGRVVSTDLRSTGEFETSDVGLNTLQQVILNGQTSNFTAVPTDCPQRDERLGWAGDAAAYAPTATFNSDTEDYLRKWVADLREAQQEDGSVPSVAPRVYNGANRGAGINGWGDALVLVPWTLYSRYGNTEVLAENYEAMSAWVAFLEGRGRLQPALGYGDWLSVESSPTNVVNTAYFAQSVRLLAQIADVLGKTEDQETYQALYEEVRAAFQDAYLAPDGTVSGDTQTVYALALEFGLVPEGMVAATGEKFVATIARADRHLTTGYLGTPYLLDALTNVGRADLAYQIVQQDSYPGWLYMITKGSTTLWERWDSLEPDGTYNRSSFNHYALGAVGDWMYRVVGGLAPAAPGYKKSVIRPQIAGINGGGAAGLGGVQNALTHAATSLDTAYGNLAVDWRISGRSFTMLVEVPRGTSATVYVPTFGGDVQAPRGARLLGVENGEARYDVGAGSWDFSSTLRQPVKTDPVEVTVNPLAAEDVRILPGRTGVAAFTAYNWHERAVTVTPEVETSDGFAAAPIEPVTIPAQTLTTIDVPVTRNAATTAGHTGTVRLTIAGDSGIARLSATDNWAVLAAPSASSTHSRFNVAAVNDGSIEGQANYAVWNVGNGWNDGTRAVFPDTLTLTWDEPVPIGRATVYTVDNTTNSAPSYGLRDYEVQAMVEGQWTTVATVAANTVGTIESTFSEVQATALRLYITDTNDHAYSRVVEFEAYRS